MSIWSFPEQVRSLLIIAENNPWNNFFRTRVKGVVLDSMLTKWIPGIFRNKTSVWSLPEQGSALLTNDEFFQIQYVQKDFSLFVWIILRTKKFTIRNHIYLYT